MHLSSSSLKVPQMATWRARASLAAANVLNGGNYDMHRNGRTR
ncbi:hypothetical protein PAMC26510_36100 [Caballeronia sordidicola]|uniref:Uncharacterized protein n=1 Tax=Caballeronia sordidicola TaxID=196367 RepID=A0A242M4S7_CABSO|nr:hypothetical protein PAMC26510_36100 [Caballeronia sordidicola]